MGNGEGADGDEGGELGGAGFASNRFINPRVLGGSDRLDLAVLALLPLLAVLGRCCNDR
jgi:hypothetical protein